MDKISVLFVCVHNSARSQMAEAFLKLCGKNKYKVESAGIEPGRLNPIVVEVMQELGIDISSNKTKDVFDFIKNGSSFSYVIAVCDESSAERCPTIPGTFQRLHWGFNDPSSLSGSKEYILEETRKIRDEISNTVDKWVKELESATDKKQLR
jgi:arsenate reductase (thioredoxin)